MKQLVLRLCLDAPPTLDNFVAGANQPLLEALTKAARTPGEHLYLWGPSGSGRTHLLKASADDAIAASRAGIYLASNELELEHPPGAVLAVDDVDRLNPEQQIALFNVFNRAGSQGQTLIVAGNTAPLALPLREDLRTRIGQALIFHVQPLDDLARSAILLSQATRRGLNLEEDVISYLLRHGRRDVPSLLEVLNTLDQASLEHKRPITLPLLRQMMQAGLDI